MSNTPSQLPQLAQLYATHPRKNERAKLQPPLSCRPHTIKSPLPPISVSVLREQLLGPANERGQRALRGAERARMRPADGGLGVEANDEEEGERYGFPGGGYLMGGEVRIS